MPLPPGSGPDAPRRAIWGLVNDGYALVAKTANLTHDEAFELCRVPDIGDPSAYLDQGVAYLHAPKWGHVFARYFTNAERDSAGRASLVYDVVALTDAQFAALGNDALQALPPLAMDRRPERLGELPLPAPSKRDDAAESERLATLLDGEDPATLAVLLGALLAGDRVLCVAAGIRPDTIECITLLFPPVLRPLLTFQTPTVDYPRHTPRLTVAERAHALLIEREWTAVLPRDADDPRLAEPMATAQRLIALGRTGDRLRRAWTAVGAGGRPDLHAAVLALLRMDLLAEGLRTGDLRRAVLVPARSEDAGERLRLAETLFDHAGPDRVAAALADVVRGEQRGAWIATQAVGAAVAHHREERPERFAQFFRTLLDGLHDAPVSPADAVACNARVMLACAAASLDDLDRFLAVADPGLPWESAWRDGSARWVKGRSAVARLFDALASKGATYGDALDGVHAIAQVAATATGRSRERASAIAVALVRRTLRSRATLEPPDRLGALVEALIRVWSPDVASRGGAGAATDDGERALRRLLGVGESPAGGDPRRVAAEVSRTIAESPDGSGATELLGWMVAALERAHAGSLGDFTVRVGAAVLEEQRRLAPRSEMPAHVGRVLLHFAAVDAAFVLRPAWLDVVRQVDDASRRELLARALGWVVRGYASGRFTIGTFADACVIAGGEGGTIDDATVELLVPHLATVAGSRSSLTEVSLLAATLTSVATPAAATRLIGALLESADDALADGVRMRRLAHALHEVERVRDEARYEDARTTLRRVLARRGAIGAEEERALRAFLGVDDGSVIGRLIGRLPTLTNGTSAAGGARR
jgi:hypothetical protein